jgi:hypothetical protein
LKETAALLLRLLLLIFYVNASEYCRLYWVIVPLFRTCLIYVFVGLSFVAVLRVSVGAEACCRRPAITAIREPTEAFTKMKSRITK